MNVKLLETLRVPFAYWRGILALRFKNHEKAEVYFKIAVLANPNHAESLFKLGFVQAKQSKWESAFPNLQKAIFLKLENLQWLTQLRNVERKLDPTVTPRSYLSVDEIQARIEELPESVFLYSQLARALRRQSKWWLEVEALKEAVMLDGNDELLRFRYGYALAGMKRFRDAAEQFQLAVELRPGVSEWYYQLGCALASPDVNGPGDLDAARPYFDKAVEMLKSKQQKRLGIGAFHQRSGNWTLAAEAFMAQTRKDPENAQLHFFLGDAQQHLYQWAEAAEAFRRAVELNHERPNWHYRLGFVSERLGNFVEATEAYAVAVRISSEPMPLWNYRLGYALEHTGQFAEACSAFSNALDQTPTADVGDSNELRTIDEIRQLLDMDATNPTDWRELGILLEGNKEWTGAAAAYGQAIARNGPHDPDLYHRRGRCFAEAGLHLEACASYRSTRILQQPYGISQAKFRSNLGLRISTSYTEYHEHFDLIGKKILYESFHGNQMSCNPYALFVHLLSDPEYDEWTHVWVINDNSKIPFEYRNLRNVIFIPRDTDGYMRHVATSKILINNTTFPTWFMRKKGQIYLNTWHGTPWKTLGKDDKSQDFSVYGNLTRNLLHATHIITSNPHTTRILMERFDVAHLFTGVVAETGYPRIDLTLNLTSDEKQNLKSRLGIAKETKVLLYAPTWRGKLGEIESDEEDLVREIDELNQTEFHILYRGHFLGQNISPKIAVPEEISTNELLGIVDVLVTDYSSISFDFMATGKPIIYYLKDYEEYKSQRGLYFDVNELPGTVCLNLSGLRDTVSAAMCQDAASSGEKWASAHAKFCPYEDGKASARVMDLITSQPSSTISRSKNSILIYGGYLEGNGMTASLINLLDHVDYNRINVTLAVDSLQIQRSELRKDQLNRLNGYVNIASRTGRMNLTLEESAVCDYFNINFSLPNNPEFQSIFASAFSREFVRLFGNVHFDSAIEFSGYSSFWSALIAYAPADSIGHKVIYMHSDKHNEWITKYPQLERMFRHYPRFDRLISVCEATRDLNMQSLATLFDLPAHRFHYCDNMLHPEKILEAAEEPLEFAEDSDFFNPSWITFIAVARLSVEKDHEKLIRAFAILRESQPTTRLMLVGDGPLSATLKRLVDKLSLAGYVHFMGYRKNPFPYMKRADCFIFSSNYEGQGLVLFEAMILGRPIISTDIPACRSVIQDRSGLLVENSITGLARGMAEFCEGKLSAKSVDLSSYQEKALMDFHDLACNLSN